MAQKMVTRSRETFTGGYDYIVRWLDREAPTEQQIRARLWNHFDTPRSEQGAFWQGVQQALGDAIHALDEKGA